jgi:regulator of protease activity HflC (stomatin/prohibitin superfamily)
VFREIAPAYLVREMFSTKREEIRQMASARIATKLGGDGIIVKEVVLRDIQLPQEYAKGLEGLLLKSQENERLTVDLEVKLKMVRSAELEAEALKAREVKAAEARSQVTVLEAKAQADAMQHTLPLKEKQIQQSRLEAEARKEATVKNAEALASAKVIDSKAELEKRKLMSESDDYRIRKVAGADAERMRLEASVLKDNPLLIQKIIAEKLSDKVQIIMVPNDGKSFFANDVLKGLSPAITR